MKKTLILAAAAFVLSASAAYADHHEGKHHDHKGKMFEKSDTDGDGYISYDEFVASREAHFKKMDADGDGRISKDEMFAMRQKMHDKMKERREETHGDSAESE